MSTQALYRDKRRAALPLQLDRDSHSYFYCAPWSTGHLRTRYAPSLFRSVSQPRCPAPGDHWAPLLW